MIYKKIKKIFSPNLGKKIPGNTYQKFLIENSYPPGIQGDGHIKWIEKNVKQFAKILKKQCSPEVILDIGSLNGIESLMLSEIFPSAKIYTFEPNPESFEVVKKITQNAYNIQIFKLAVSDENKQGKFFITPNMGTSSILEPIGGPAGNECVEIDVTHMRIDTWANNHNLLKIDAVWMDVQGSEALVLNGFGKLLSKVQVLKTEVGKKAYYKGHNLYDDILPYLKGMKLIKKNSDSKWEDDVIFVRY